jgi:hypothetical protein
MALSCHTSHTLFYIQSGRTPSDQLQYETGILCTYGEAVISSQHYLLNRKHLILEFDKLQKTASEKFNIQSLFIDEMAVKVLLALAKHTGRGNCKTVRCRSTPLEWDDGKKDKG